MTLQTLFWKVVARGFRMLSKLSEKAENHAKRQRCTSASTAILFDESRVNNAGGQPAAIRIGAHSRIHGFLQVFGKGHITIGDHVFIGPQTRLWSHALISIGDRVLIAHDVNIIDSNSHSLSAAERHDEFASMLPPGGERLAFDVKAAAIIIEDDAWIGYGASIMKGTRIGRGAIVGANTVVTRDIPSQAIVVGNPMRVIGSSLP